MRNLLSTLAIIICVAPSIGCRSQNTPMTNPFLGADRVPPPATRTLPPGSAQPYYPGSTAPSLPPVVPPNSMSPDVTPQTGYQPPSTYVPPPTGVTPPGGWNSAVQPPPNSYASPNVLPNNSAVLSNNTAPTSGLTPDPFVVPTLPPQQVSPYPNQVAVYPNQPQQQFIQQTAAIGQQREVSIRAISSENLDTSRGQPVSSDGFRPQGSN